MMSFTNARMSALFLAGSILSSVKFRLVALSVLISAAALIGLSALLYNGIKESQQQAFDSSLFNHAVDVAAATDLTILGSLIVRREALVDERKSFPFPLGQSIVQIRAIEGAIILSTKPLTTIMLPLDRRKAMMVLEKGAAFQTIQALGGEFRLIDYLIEKPPLPPLILQLAVPTTMLKVERSQVLSLLFTLIPLALAAAGGGGLLIVRRALDPVSKITKTARSIQVSELSRRVPVPAETEFKELAITLNELLSRLELAFQGQEKFIADASHQLKTPLAIMRGEIDVFKRSAQEVQANGILIDSVSQEIDQLSHLVDDLLLLARFDSGFVQPELQRTRIDEVLIDAIAQAGRLAKTKKVEIRLNVLTKNDDSSEFESKADPELLKALFFNLIENAIKYSPCGQIVDVRIKSDESISDESIQIDIEDRGPGISDQELPRIFDRFFRGGVRQHQAPGVGLGLSIAQRISRLHAGELTAKSEFGHGSCFTVRIKKV